VELQADEIRTIVGGKQQQIWVFVIDVGVPAVASTVIGIRSYQNTLSLSSETRHSELNSPNL
jgi:hypothetical protein